MKRNINIGLFGFGVVGQGLYAVLNNSSGFKANIEKFVVKHRDKKRTLPAELFHYEAEFILDDPEITTVVELIDDADDAFTIVKTALLNGKDVVTANKKMIALHLPELYDLQKETGRSLLYEASACGGIPIVRTLEEYYDNESLIGVEGIFNGSSNYILSRLAKGGGSFGESLAKAQALGFAESDPTLDIEGYDALYKLIIIAAHAFGVWLSPDELPRVGISHIGAKDLEYARDNGYVIKQIASVNKVGENTLSASLLPTFIPIENPLAQVNDEYNAVVVEAAFSDKQFFMGKGAGGYPTGSAVLSDISAMSYEYRYEYKKRQVGTPWKLDDQSKSKIYCRFPSGSSCNFFTFEQIIDKFWLDTELCIIGVVQTKVLKNIDQLENNGVSVISF